MHSSRRTFTGSLIGAATALGTRALRAAEQSPAEWTGLTLSEAAEKIRTRAVSPSELVKACLDRIEVYQPKLNAFITVTRETALSQAKTLDAEQRAGKLPPWSTGASISYRRQHHD